MPRSSSKPKPPDSPSEYLLSLETSGPICSVAVLQEGQLVAERLFAHNQHLSERLPAVIDGVLNDAGLRLQEIGMFAVGVGPGSFTGLRIGVTTVKMLAEVFHRTVYAISSFRANVETFRGLSATDAVVAMPGRANHVLLQPFRCDCGEVVAMGVPSTVSITDLGEQLSGLYRPLMCGPEALALRAQIACNRPELATSLSVGRIRLISASVVGYIAWELRRSGIDGEDPVSLAPLYVAPPAITRPKEDPVALLPRRTKDTGR